MGLSGPTIIQVLCVCVCDREVLPSESPLMVKSIMVWLNLSSACCLSCWLRLSRAAFSCSEEHTVRHAATATLQALQSVKSLEIGPSTLGGYKTVMCVCVRACVFVSVRCSMSVFVCVGLAATCVSVRSASLSQHALGSTH